jgi:hypothetical protein
LAYWDCCFYLPPNKRIKGVMSNWEFFNKEWNVGQEKNREQIRLSGVNISGMAKGSSNTNTPQKQEKIYSQEKTHKKFGELK